MGLIRLCLMLFAWLWLQPGYADIQLSDGVDKIPAIGEYLEYLEDPGAALSLDDVRGRRDHFRQSVEAAPNFGFTSSAYWLRVRINQAPDGNATWYLKLAYPLLDSVEVYFEFDNGKSERIIAGDSIPFAARAVKNRAFVFPVDFTPERNSVEIFIRVKTGSSMQLPIGLWQTRAFHEENHTEQLILGMYYGLLLAILIYNALLGISVREPVYAYYALYVMVYGIFQLCLNGLAYEYLWPNSTYLAEQGTLISMALSALFATLFSRNILHISPRQPMLNRLFNYYTCCCAAVLCLCFFVPYAVAIKLQTLVVILGTFIFAASGWVQFQAGVPAARYYLLAWSLFLVGILVYGLKSYALLPENLFTEYAIQMGSALEVMLLSFALAHRFKALRAEKFRIQREATEMLEQRVTERTAALEHTLTELSNANKQLELLSNIDGLTGVYNRAFFKQHFNLLWKSSRREQKPLAVLMIDIDHFKAVNDNHGHLIGDKVLVAVSRIISDSLYRANDVVARYGGEEFIAVLPATELVDALSVAERVRRAVSEHSYATGEGAVAGNISVSIGVAVEIPDASDGISASDSLIAAADSALYQAKNLGRNRVCAADGNLSARAA